MSKAALSKRKRPGAGAGRAKKAQALAAEEHVQMPVNAQTGLGNLAFQRMLGLSSEVTSQGPSAGRSANWTSVLRQAKPKTAAPVSNGKVTVKPVQVQYYEVKGRSLAEVIKQLDPNEWGLCETSYAYSYATTAGRTTKVDLTVSIQMRLPRWSGEGHQRASRPARQEWDRMLKALRCHEDGHVQIGQEWGTKLREGLLGQDESILEEVRARLEAEGQKAHDDFDDKTGHGQNQGVSLDVSIK